MRRIHQINTAGFVLVSALVFGAIAALATAVLSSWAATTLSAVRRSASSEQAFQIAEAGIEYYRWHLAHAPSDFQDGTGAPGPYVHTFTDKNGVVIGEFSLTITEPPVGSTLVKIVSVGTVTTSPSAVRTVESHLAIPSWAKYAVVANDVMRFGAGTEVFGPLHSNNGIRFDGIAHNLVTSARSDYDDPDHSGANEFGVHTHVNPPPGSGIDNSFRPLEAPPNPVQTRADVFFTGRQFPVPAVDFAGLTSDLSQIKADAQAAGHYFAPSGSLGYHVVLKTDDTFDLYRVTALQSAPSGCNDPGNQPGWGTWSIRSANGEVFLANYAFPANGLVFLEDHVWVDGHIATARITIVSGRFPDNPSTRSSITVNNDLRYTNSDGQDVVALIAQNNINVGLFSDDNLEIDAALVAQYGRVGRYYYRGPGGGSNRCSPNHVRSQLDLYGMIGTNQRYGFAYTDGTGYTIRNIVYDANLLYGPPPSFPLTSDQYSTVYWSEK